MPDPSTKRAYKRPLHQDAATLLPGVAITVEHEIGRIQPDPDGEPSLIVGFRVIAEYENDHHDGGKYRVPLPDGGIAVIEVDYEHGEDR
jgi:hypothetical protein